MANDTWQKSSYSAANDNCVEVRAVGGLVELRESDDGELILRTAPDAFVSLLQVIKVGDLDARAFLGGSSLDPSEEPPGVMGG